MAALDLTERKGIHPAMEALATSARVDADDVLWIRWTEPPAQGTALSLRRAHVAKPVPLDGETVDLSLLGLTEGTWTLYAGDHEVLTMDPGFSLDGLAAYARRPRERAMRVLRDRRGRLLLSVRAVEPYAEATAARPEDGRLEFEGYFAYGHPPVTAEFVATRRETGDQVKGEATVTGDRWSAELPTEPFTVEGDRGFWDLRLGDHFVATFLDDITAKKKKVRFPAVHIDRGADRVRVRPYYTVEDHLAIATTVVARAEAQ